ncbi:DNA mismatch repair protein [Pedobacter petrophilus]|uniref:DNA mismatch repair protein n=1 Tax=Pedobacter petrophilus TaxID=1908241 RepID=A0A7K0G3B3_9SPHI|nr:DNA mismatch repair protein [Pedobacter petrophilus]MRX78303.1 DNA mismatch repair protein [Pedobacter petrophilus]
MHKFDIDKQTLTDLNIFDSPGLNKSVFSLFNFTNTIKGNEELMQLFRSPTTNIKVIHHRQELIRYLFDYSGSLALDRTNMDFVEGYLRLNDKVKYYSPINALINSVSYFFTPNQTYYLKEKGIKSLLNLCRKLNELFAGLDSTRPDLVVEFDEVIAILDENDLFKELVQHPQRKLTLFELEQLDFIFRGKAYKTIKQLLNVTYKIDAFYAIVLAARKHNLILPTVTTNSDLIHIKGVFHPFLDAPVANDVSFSEDKNVCFLTGSNMAGKSTFLKSIGVAIFLAHVGLPVPAQFMETGIGQGLISTINLPDNLNAGYSHFYNEVLRVKHVAEVIKNKKNIFVIFDELFRGTNVKDAFDGSLSITQAFSKIADCRFIISTHIVEVAESLKQNENIMFKYLFTKMADHKPVFTYKLMDGITDERIGMWIIENESIIQILENRKV